MPDQDQIQDIDFDSQLRGLFEEAEKQIEDLHAPAPRPRGEKSRAEQGDDAPLKESLPQMLRPILLGIQAAARAAGENNALLQKIGEKLEQRTEAAEAPAGSLPEITERLRSLLEQKSGVSQKMFAALHEELKGYKDNFLLEALHKPIIRDLISLHDDFSKIHRQLQEVVLDVGEVCCGTPSESLGRLKTLETNVAHNCGFIIEVLARLEVGMLPPGEGRLDKVTQRALRIEDADLPEQDGEIVRSLKPGFMWRGRVFRAEEVVIRKWKEANRVAVAAAVSEK
jgi:molecular chaperone GrpE (heat shock protein)